MALDPCDPKDIATFAKHVAQNKMGETTVERPMELSIDIPEGAAVAKDPAALAKAMYKEGIVGRVLGLLQPIRTMRGVFGDYVRVHAIDPLLNIEIKSNNFISKMFKEYKDATKPLRGVWGLSREADEKLAQAITKIDRDGVYHGPAGAFDAKTIEAATKVRAIYNRLFKEHGIDDDLYINFYRPLVKDRPGGIFYTHTGTPMETEFKKLIHPSNIEFYQELERKGLIMDPDQTLTAGFAAYIRGIASAKMKKPFIEQLEKDFVNPYFGIRWSRDLDGKLTLIAKDETGYALWKELVHNVFGGPTPLDKSITRNLQNIAAMFGKTTDTRAAYKISHGIAGGFFAGAMGSPLGGRPSSIVRQLFQLVPTYAELGSKYTMMGIQKAMTPGSIEPLYKMNLITSPIEGLADSLGLAKGAGKVVSDITENFLKIFGSIDQFTRAATAYGAEARFRDYMARYGKEEFVKKLGGKREFLDELTRMVKAGNIEGETGAIQRYMFETVGNLQYFYGKANKPEAFRGAVGNLLGVLMSYPMNSLEMVRMFSQRAMEGDAAPLARLILTSAAIVGAGSEFLNADLRSATMLGAMPHSLAIPKIAGNMFSAGNSTAEWLSGSLFNIGETDYHKAQRIQNYRDFARDMRTFVPGGVFFFEDIPRAVSEGSLARMFGLTPKADIINLQARARISESRSATGTGFGALRGLGSTGTLASASKE